MIEEFKETDDAMRLDVEAFLWREACGARMARQESSGQMFKCCVVPKDTPRGMIRYKCVKFDENLICVGSVEESRQWDESHWAPKFTTDAAAALALLELCYDKAKGRIHMERRGDWYDVRDNEHVGNGLTQQIAISLYAVRRWNGQWLDGQRLTRKGS